MPLGRENCVTGFFKKVKVKIEENLRKTLGPRII